MQLPTNTLLQGGKYRIEKVLGQGGFGITYLGIQVALNRKVAIKEFFMKEYCNRDSETSHVSVPSEGSKELVNKFRKKFIKEAQTIAALNHPHIIRIYDVFEENGTAYYVMEYWDNGSLTDLVKKQGKLSEAEALKYIRQVADALGYIHERKMNHLDVKPSNILLDEKKNAVLIDFGLSKQYDEQGGQTSSTPVGISHGYAPMEQYNAGGVGTFFPATDIYSLGATFYKLLTGITPPQANEVFNDGLPAMPSGISVFIVQSITEAMRPGRKERPQSICDFLKLLENATNITTNVENDQTVFVTDNTVSSEETPPSVKRKIVRKPVRFSFPTFLKRAKKHLGFLSNIFPLKRGNGNIQKRYIAMIVGLLLIVLSAFYFYRKYITPPADYSSVAEAVDLGLSVNWASWNLGASSPDEYGAQLPWGETDEMSHGDINSDGNADISGSEYDVARNKWKGNWRIPTLREFEELRNKCEWTPEIYNGVSGHRIVGLNGNSIFLPDDWVFDSFWILDKFKYVVDGSMERIFKYWTSNEVSTGNAWSFDNCHTSKKSGLYIRPVSDNIEKQKKDSVIAEMAKASITANANNEYIDLGLSVKWATRNLGASKVEDYGSYYSWGETQTKTIYSDSTYTFNKDILDIEDIVATVFDAAYMNKTDGLRLPTKSEMQELKEKCTWVWSEYNGVKGMMGVGPNGNSIFFPAAGTIDGINKNGEGEWGDYISGTSEKSSTSIFFLSFTKYDAECILSSGVVGRSVRPVRSVTPSEGKAVDLGLSVKWADRNVGALTPADNGDYFAWGETKPKDSYYNFNSVTYGEYIEFSGDKYDAARANWGESWRLPTKDECQELVDKCKWVWTTQGGHEGYKVTGPNGNSIFLPSAGYYNGTSKYSGERYWSSSSQNRSYTAYCLYGDGVSYLSVEIGLTIRPVSNGFLNDSEK